jgi:hypothetical protein
MSSAKWFLTEGIEWGFVGRNGLKTTDEEEDEAGSGECLGEE